MADMKQQEMDELQQWGLKMGEKGSTDMEPESVRLLLDGFFNRFKLTPPAAMVDYRVDQRTGDPIWMFTGFRRWWDQPGAPCVPNSELSCGDTTRLRRIVQAVFKTAVQRNDLSFLTTLSGADRAILIRGIGIGA